MASKKTTSTPKRKTVAPPAKARPAATSTAVRNTAVPKIQPATPRREVTHEAIARRAYEIWRSGTGGTETENWIRAERELRGSGA